MRARALVLPFYAGVLVVPDRQSREIEIRVVLRNYIQKRHVVVKDVAVQGRGQVNGIGEQRAPNRNAQNSEGCRIKGCGSQS